MADESTKTEQITDVQKGMVDIIHVVGAFILLPVTASSSRRPVIMHCCIFTGDPDFSAKHPLETKWTLWFDNPEGKQKQNHTQWGQTLRAVYTFGTVEDFWWYV